MTTRWGVCIVAAVVALAGESSSAFAAPTAPSPPPAKQGASEKAAADTRARELFQKGDTAYAEGRYEEALSAFQEAHDLSGRPQLLFNISNALERLGRYTEAVDALDKYLASGKARDREVVQKRLANLKKRVEEQKRTTDAEQQKKLEDEKRKKEEEDKKSAGAVPSTATGKDEDKPKPATTSSAGEKGTSTLPIVVLGIGGAALITSGVFGVLTLSARSDVDAGCKDGPSGRLCNAEAQSAIDRDKTFGLVTDIALVSGVILAGVGVYLLLTDSKKEAPKPAVKLGARMLTFGGTF